MAEHWDVMLKGCSFPGSVHRRLCVAQCIAENDFRHLGDMVDAECASSWASSEGLQPDEIAFLNDIVIPKAKVRVRCGAYIGVLVVGGHILWQVARKRREAFKASGSGNGIGWDGSSARFDCVSHLGLMHCWKWGQRRSGSRE